MSNINASGDASGDRPPVLLLHGFGSSFDHGWQATGWVDALRDAGREVLGVDLLGHGPGPHETDDAAYDDLEAHAFSPAAGRAPVDAVGFSLGGMVLLRLAVEEPRRFRRLVVMGVGDAMLRLSDAPRPLPDVRGILAGAEEGDDPDTAVLRSLVTGTTADRDALARVLNRRQHPLSSRDLGTVAHPTLLVIGADDFSGPAERLSEVLPNAVVQVLPRTDHFATPSSFRALKAALRHLDAD